MWLLRLYISHEDNSSATALTAVNEFLEKHRSSGCKVQVVDIDSQKDLARKDGVRNAPVLVKVAPPPTKTIIPITWEAACLAAELEAE
jgi:hypothetical protein